MAAIFGLDFGTTNSIAAVIRANKALPLLDRETNRPHPSAIWFQGDSAVVGREARKRLGDPATADDIERSPKAHLGKSGTFFCGGVERAASDVVAEVIKHIRKDAMSRGFTSENFDRAVLTIPVGLTGKGRLELRDAALKAGIHVHQFVHEPLAALYGWLRRFDAEKFGRKLTELEGRLALVFDWGGGTLDLTLCRFFGGDLIQVQNKFDNRVGGDRFDEQIRSFVLDRHAHRYGLTDLPAERPGAAGTLLDRCELAKIDLSERDASAILVANMFQSDGEKQTLEETLSRSDAQQAVGNLIDQGIGKIDELLDAARIRPEQIALCLATGGMVQMPSIRNRLLEKFGPARVPFIENGDKIIAEGAAWIAHDQRRVRLAKPFELVHADDAKSYLTIFRPQQDLPHEGQPPINRKILVYCVDPRDGFAKLQFVRPRFPDQSLPSDPRDDYTTMTVRVDEMAKPLREQIEVTVTIDHNFIATVSGRSLGDFVTEEVHDLEFGLSIRAPEGSQKNGGREKFVRLETPSGHKAGSVRVRANIIDLPNRIDLIPGEIVEYHHPGYYQTAPRTQAVARQRDEDGYYKLCAKCLKKLPDVVWNGCDMCESAGAAFSTMEAKRRRDAGENLWIERRR